MTRTEFAGCSADVSEVFHDVGGVENPAGTQGRGYGNCVHLLPDVGQERNYAMMREQTEKSGDLPVTIEVIRCAQPGKKGEFEKCLSGMIAASMKFPGHLGTTVFQPASAHDHRYTIIFKFDRLSHFHRWEEAVERHEWSAQVRAFQRAEPRMRVLTGLETWLTCPAHSTSAPSRYRMTLITWLAAFLLLTGLYLLFGSILSQMPP